MLFDFQIEILKNIKFQNRLLLKQYKHVLNNQIDMKNLSKKVNAYEKNKIIIFLLISIFLLQLIILFKQFTCI